MKVIPETLGVVDEGYSRDFGWKQYVLIVQVMKNIAS
jgi:hypothetical protein